MARTRNLKPAFFKNEDLGDLPPLARLMFAGLWGLADREGILEDRPRRLQAELLPYDDCDGDELLRALADSPGRFIVRYEIEGGRYIFIPSFSKHQNPHRDEKSAGFPPPPGISTVQAPCKHRASTVQEPCKDDTCPEPEPDKNSSSRALNLKPSSCAPSTNHLKPSSCLDESSRVDHLDLSSKEEETSVLECARRLFSKPVFKDKTPEDREFLLKLATLRIREQIPEGCLQDGLEAIRRRGAGLPDKPVAYLTTVLKDWLVKNGKTPLERLLAGVEIPPGLVKPKKDQAA
ncbi:MAG: hypothetical protein JXM70_14625 [Pirellulales bacterium]|nr:hypothetical protein [Pirellulales bacterium]